MFDNMLGNRLKETRINANKTQEQVARMLGVTRGAYSHFENNRNQPDNATLVKLAQYFGVTTDYLLGNTNSESDNNMTVAAHVDEDVTDEEMDEIIEYIKKIKSKHANKN